MTMPFHEQNHYIDPILHVLQPFHCPSRVKKTFLDQSELTL